MRGTQWAQVTVSKHIMAHAVCMRSVVEGCGQRLDQSEFRHMTEVSFSRTRQPSERKRKKTSGSRESARQEEVRERIPMPHHGFFFYLGY